MKTLDDWLSNFTRVKVAANNDQLMKIMFWVTFSNYDLCY